MEKVPVRMQLKATSAAGESLIAKVMGTVKHRIAARSLTPARGSRPSDPSLWP